MSIERSAPLGWDSSLLASDPGVTNTRRRSATAQPVGANPTASSISMGVLNAAIRNLNNEVVEIVEKKKDNLYYNKFPITVHRGCPSRWSCSLYLEV